MKELIKKIKKARHVYVCGNGGSAATAEHFTNDLFSMGIKAYCLNSNVSIMTMIGNDFGYEFVYGRQLELYANEDDLLITISCSGTSSNVVYAQAVAEAKGMDIYSFDTFKEYGKKDYGKLEDEHMILVHKVKEALNER